MYVYTRPYGLFELANGRVYYAFGMFGCIVVWLRVFPKKRCVPRCKPRYTLWYDDVDVSVLRRLCRRPKVLSGAELVLKSCSGTRNTIPPVWSGRTFHNLVPKTRSKNYVKITVKRARNAANTYLQCGAQLANTDFGTPNKVSWISRVRML